MAKLNKTNFVIKLKRGLRSNLLVVTNYFLQGEVLYTTDTKHLFIADASYIPQPVATLDMAVTFEGEIIINSGEIVWTY